MEEMEALAQIVDLCEELGLDFQAELAEFQRDPDRWLSYESRGEQLVRVVFERRGCEAAVAAVAAAGTLLGFTPKSEELLREQFRARFEGLTSPQ